MWCGASRPALRAECYASGWIARADFCRPDGVAGLVADGTRRQAEDGVRRAARACGADQVAAGEDHGVLAVLLEAAVAEAHVVDGRRRRSVMPLLLHVCFDATGLATGCLLSSGDPGRGAGLKEARLPLTKALPSAGSAPRQTRKLELLWVIHVPKASARGRRTGGGEHTANVPRPSFDDEVPAHA